LKMEVIMSFLKNLLQNLLAFMALALLCGCYPNGGGTAEDTALDPDIVEGTEVAEDPSLDQAEDPPEDEETVLPCTGGESLTIVYLDPEGNPVADLAVALDAGGNILEAATDDSGTVTFEGLDYCNVPVDVTCVGERYAYTLTDIGGMGRVPDPLTITLEVLDWVIYPEIRPLSGNAVHIQEGSGMIVSVPGMTNNAGPDRYDLRTSFVGTNIPMSVFEFTGESEARVPIGYELIRYDTPPEGVDGPDAAPVPAEFQTASVRLDYDIAPDSPFHEPQLINPMQEGVIMKSGGESLDLWNVGFQTTWTRGGDFDTLEAAWTEEAMSEAVDPNFYVSVWAYRREVSPYLALQVVLKLPDDPDAWDAVTVHDAAEYAGAVQFADPENAAAFDFEFSFDAHPAFHIVRHQIAAYDRSWHIESPAQRSPISFASMPWPSSIDQSAFFANPDIPAMYLSFEAMSFDENPFNGYARWSTMQWKRRHYTSITHAFHYCVQLP